MSDNTLNYNFILPEVDGSDDLWGDMLNQNWSDLDTLLKAQEDATSGLQGDVNTLQGDVNTLQGDVNTLEGRTLTAGNGLTGGGDLSSNRTISVADGGITESHLSDKCLLPRHFTDGVVGAEFLGTGGDMGTWVRERIAAASGVGIVGAYALLRNDSEAIVNQGGTVAGSDLIYMSAGGVGSGASPSGTWMCLGRANSNTGPEATTRTTLFMRVS